MSKSTTLPLDIKVWQDEEHGVLTIKSYPDRNLFDRSDLNHSFPSKLSVLFHQSSSLHQNVSLVCDVQFSGRPHTPSVSSLNSNPRSPFLSCEQGSTSFTVNPPELIKLKPTALISLNCLPRPTKSSLFSLPLVRYRNNANNIIS